MIDPRGLSLPAWTTAATLTLATQGPVEVLRGDDWVSWALVVLAIPTIAAFQPPQPSGFTDWRHWAERFVQSVPL